MTKHQRSITKGRIGRRAALRLLGLAPTAAAALALSDELFAAGGQPGAWFGAAAPAPVQFPPKAIIRTVTRDVRPADLPAGSVQIHEHLGGIFTPAAPLRANDIPPGVFAPADEAEYLTMMVDELKMSRAEGVSLLVDAAAAGRRDQHTVDNLRQIAERSEVHIVVAGGYYQDVALPTRYPPKLRTMTESELEAEFVEDARTQRWGAFGEIASSQPMQEDERKVFRAIGRAHGRTNLPIFTHTPHEGCPQCATEQLATLESVGVDPRRVCIGHLATIKPDAEPLGRTAIALGKRGAFLGFDTVGHMMGRSMIPEAHKVKHVLAVLNAGLEDHVLLSADSTPVPQLKTNWGQGYSSVITQFVPKLRYAGVSDALLHKILVDNPRRFLAFVPR